MYQTSYGIILKKTEYSENSYILRILTSSNGVFSFSLKTAGGRLNNKLRSIINQPMSIVEFEYLDRQNKDILPLRNISFHQIYNDIPYNIFKQAILLYLNELIVQTVRLPLKDDYFYSFISESLLRLDNMDNGLGNFPLWFTYELSNKLGFGIKVDIDRGKKIFNIEKGEFVYETQTPSILLDVELSMILKNFLIAKEPFLIQIPKIQRSRLIKTALDFYSFHGDFDLELKSLDILHQIFE